NRNPTLATPQPFRDNQRFALLPNISGSGALTNRTSANSTGAAPGRMSQETSSSAETENDNERVTPKQSRTRVITRHPRTSMLSSGIKISNDRRSFRSSPKQSPSDRSPISMHATVGGIAARQSSS